MNHWLTVFTEDTWRQFCEMSPKVCAFPEPRNRKFPTIQIGDRLLCYIAGKMVWAGILKIIGDRVRAQTPIYVGGIFPIRFPVEPEIITDPDGAVSMSEFEGLLSFFPVGGSGKNWAPHLRNSPKKFHIPDACAIVQMLESRRAA